MSPFRSALTPATEQIRKKITSLLLDASQSLEDVFRVHDDALVLKVQNAVQQLLTLFKEFHLSASDPYLRFNAVQTGLLLDSTS